MKPIPLYEMHIRLPSDSSGTALRTGLDGRAEATLPAGGYVLASDKPVTIDGVSYRWKVAVQVTASRTVTVELTNANADTTGATTLAATRAPTGGREVASEMKVFGRVKEGVVKVMAGTTSGTAFMVDSSGLFLTNAHVVDGASDAVLSVMLDTLTRVSAQVVLRAHETDLAIIRIDPSLARGRPVAVLDTKATAQVGEKVFALGYPLGQELVLTTGVVSGVRDGAIITDVNINHGNSGGPMYAMDGTVVAVNTFGLDGKGGPGIYGAIAIGKGLPLVDQARVRAASMPMPSAAKLPVTPRASISVADAKAAVASQPKDVWKTYRAIEMDRFMISVETPFQAVAAMAMVEAESGKDRKKREEKAGIDQEERYSELRGLHDYYRYAAGNDAAQAFVPAVGINISPKIGETTGSFFRRLAVASTVGTDSKKTVRYKSDLRSAAIYRNMDTVEVFIGGAQPMREYVNNQWVDMRDVANTGYYLIPIETFAPDADGTVPVVTIVLQDLKNPDDPSCGSLKPELVAGIWNQFEQHLRTVGVDFVAADPRKVRPDAGQVRKLFCQSVPAEELAGPKVF